MASKEIQSMRMENVNGIKGKGPGRAHFNWATREEGSFKWFKGIMRDVAKCDHNVLLETCCFLESCTFQCRQQVGQMIRRLWPLQHVIEMHNYLKVIQGLLLLQWFSLQKIE